MKKLNPSDLDKILTLDGLQKIDVDQLVKLVKTRLKRSLLEAEIRGFDSDIRLTTTRTRFGGEKFWFVCPACGGRCGQIYVNVAGECGCRKCVGVNYECQIKKW